MANRDGGLGFRPPHPGEYLREDILPALGMSPGQLAQHLGVSRQTASKLVNEKAGVSLEMAVRLGKAFRNGAQFWMALQMQHDLWGAERDADFDVKPLDWESAA